MARAAARQTAPARRRRSNGEAWVRVQRLSVPASIRCPRCKQSLEADDPEVLADDLLAHLRTAHGHEPPREHVMARIARQNEGNGGG